MKTLFFTWLVLSVLVERLTEFTLRLLPEAWRGDFRGWPLPRWVALAWALVLAFALGVDAFAALDLTYGAAWAEYVGIVAAALLASYGSGALHDLATALASLKTRG